MARTFLWRDRKVEIQTHYHDHGLCVLALVDDTAIGCYPHFEQALAAIRAVVILNQEPESSLAKDFAQRAAQQSVCPSCQLAHTEPDP
ncbi:MAG: hypothetical protein HC918_08780 [Oscillatoriales cyanobacterium SM2_1_8]|nr:hypothetical protein [Oscillatoriales cyanobacterium SM2_1_8]